MVHLAFFLPAMAAATVNVPAPAAHYPRRNQRRRFRRHRPRRPWHLLREHQLQRKAITVTSSGGPAVTIIDGSKTSTAKVEANLTGSGK